MRSTTIVLTLLGLAAWAGAPAWAGKEEDRLIGGILSGVLGVPAQQQPAPDAAYLARERERLAQYLQSGEYVTSRQGEPVDLMVAGVPLTHRDHVYTARPVPPSLSAPQGVQ